MIANCTESPDHRNMDMHIRGLIICPLAQTSTSAGRCERATTPDNSCNSHRPVGLGED